MRIRSPQRRGIGIQVRHVHPLGFADSAYAAALFSDLPHELLRLARRDGGRGNAAAKDEIMSFVHNPAPPAAIERPRGEQSPVHVYGLLHGASYSPFLVN